MMLRPFEPETETDAIREELGSLYAQYADLWLLPLLDREGPVWIAASLQRLLAAESDRFRIAGDVERADRYQAAGGIYQVALLALRGLGWSEVYHPALIPYEETTTPPPPFSPVSETAETKADDAPPSSE